MRLAQLLVAGALLGTSIVPIQAAGNDAADAILPDPKELQDTYEYYDVLSDEFNGEVSDMWLMDYMPWWSDTAQREQSGTKTRYRFIDADSADNQSLQIYVNGENRMGEENFQPYYLEKLSGPQSMEAKDRYLAATNQKNNWNSKFAGFMAGSKDYLNTYRGSEAPIEHHTNYSDAGATTYGYFEARVKFLSMDRGEGLAPAFWFIGMQDDIYDRGEVDVFEFLDNHTLDFTIHPKGDPNITKVTKQFHFDEDMSKDYHTYGVLWDETGFSLYVDGEFLWKHEQKIDYRMIPMFSINHHENGWIGSVDGKGHPEERTMDIDYFRVFKKVGTDPEPNEPVLPEMEPGTNVAEGAYISLFGLTGPEADATPVQWLNDKETTNTVLSGICDPMGDPMERSTLPQYLYIDWKTPATFDTIILHAQNAASSAPTLVDVEISEDGKNWTPIKEDVTLQWQSDSQIAEAQTIELDEVLSGNLHTRIKIKEANLNAQGRFGLCEVEIGEDITPMDPEYLPLPDPIDTNLEGSMFTTWELDGNDVSNTGLQLTYKEGTQPNYGEGKNGQAMVIDGNTQYIYAPLKDGETHLKSDEDFTLGMWIKPDYVQLGSDQVILAQQTGSSGGRPWLFMYNGTLGTFLGNENTFGSIALKANEWQYVAVTFHVTDEATKQGEVILYVNGKQDTKKTITYEEDALADAQLLLGRHKNGSKGFYKGSMDDITLLNKALAPQDMEALYEAGGQVDQIEAKTYDLSKVVALPRIEGMVGELTMDDIVLPAQVSGVFEQIYAQSVDVAWSEEDLAALDLNQAGTYTIHGTLDLSAYPHTTNTKKITAEQTIVVKAPVDLSELSAVLDRINALDRADYTEESFDAFLSAVQSVQTKETLLIIGNYPNYSTPESAPASTTQEVIDGMVAELNDAFTLLEEVPASEEVNKDALWDLLEKYEGYRSTDYTKESWDVFYQAYEDACAVALDETATQQEVTDAKETLRKAAEALVKVSDDQTEDPAGEGSTDPDQEVTEKPADTAASMSTTMYGMMVLIAGGGVIAVKKMRKHAK